MPKILALINTPFQLIVAIQLKLTIYKEHDMDIIISNHATDYKKVVMNIQKTNIFKNVYTAFSREYIYCNTNYKKIKRNIVSMVCNSNLVKKMCNTTLGKYDIFLFFNIDCFTYLLYDFLYDKNKKISCYRFEEGFSTYLKEGNISRIMQQLRKIFQKKNLLDNLKGLYIFNKELVLYKTRYPLIEIPKIDRENKKLKEILNVVFNYDKIEDSYSKKYIFLEESFFCDNKGIEDLDLILKIADIVGKENLLVKLHPRNKIDRFAQYGISTNKTIGIPWEVIQINNDFSDKVFLTISSGSVLASRLYFKDNIKTYLLFNCTEKISDMATEQYFKYLDKVKEKFGMDDFIIPKDRNEFFKGLEEESGKNI